jgi:hypothetical protein
MDYRLLKKGNKHEKQVDCDTFVEVPAKRAIVKKF